MNEAVAAYYNDNDPYAVQWLRNLIAGKYIADGVVDGRSIKEIRPEDVAGYRQCHFFAGIGGWSYALQLAGWGDREVWTGSCPCQPFSAAGKRRGTADERHLWPDFLYLISECRPSAIIGEQVASRDGRQWLAGVRADLEALGYAVGAADLCAAGASAPHIRQRLFWMADAGSERHKQISGSVEKSEKLCSRSQSRQFEYCGPIGGVADANQGQRGRLPNSSQCERDGQADGWLESDGQPQPSGATSGLGDAELSGRPSWQSRDIDETDSEADFGKSPTGFGGAVGNFWSDAVWLPCLDGKARRIEPGTFPLAHGVPARVGRLRGYGNAIVPQLAATFIKAFLEITNQQQE